MELLVGLPDGCLFAVVGQTRQPNLQPNLLYSLFMCNHDHPFEMKGHSIALHLWRQDGGGFSGRLQDHCFEADAVFGETRILAVHSSKSRRHGRRLFVRDEQTGCKAFLLPLFNRKTAVCGSDRAAFRQR